MEITREELNAMKDLINEFMAKLDSSNNSVEESKEEKVSFIEEQLDLSEPKKGPKPNLQRERGKTPLPKLTSPEIVITMETLFYCCGLTQEKIGELFHCTQTNVGEILRKARRERND